MEHSIHRTSLIVDDPTPSSRSPPISLIFLSLLGPLYALTSNTPQTFAVLLLTITIWYFASHTPDRTITAADYNDIAVYTILAYVSASFVTSIFGNIWLRSISAHVITFLLMDLYVRYLKAKEEAARMKQKRDIQVAKYLGEPVQVEKTVSGDSFKGVMNLEGANVARARRGPSTRRQG